MPAGGVPWGADANDVAAGSDDARHELGRYLAEARWLGGAPATLAGAQDMALGAGSGRRGAKSAAPCPAGEPLSAPAVVAAHDELVVELGGHRWRVRHIPKAPTPGALRVKLMVGVGERFHVDTVDLYAARQRGAFAEAAAKSCAARQSS